MHTEYDVIYILCVWCHPKSGCGITDTLGLMTERVDVVSHILGQRADITFVFSCV